MKIFANNFAVFLTTAPAHGHFRFEGRSRAEIGEWLQGGNLLFPEQVSYHYPENESPERLADWVFALLTDVGNGMLYAVVALLFPSEEFMEKLAVELTARFKPVIAAGGLVLDDEPALLAILRDGRWDLPKGKVEAGEEIAEAAWREVAEETGLSNHSTVEKRCETYHVFPDRIGRWRLKTTHWYAMHCPERLSLVPQTAEGITEVRWLPQADLKKEVPRTYPQIMELMRGEAGKASVGNPS